MKGQLVHVPTGEAAGAARQRRLLLFRFLLGQAQMLCAAVACLYLVVDGLSPRTLIMATIATTLTLASTAIFRVLPWWRSR